MIPTLRRNSRNIDFNNYEKILSSLAEEFGKYISDYSHRVLFSHGYWQDAETLEDLCHDFSPAEHVYSFLNVKLVPPTSSFIEIEDSISLDLKRYPPYQLTLMWPGGIEDEKKGELEKELGAYIISR